MDALRAAIRDVFHVAEARATPLHGGDLSTVTLIELSDGRRAVAKQGPLVAREARMLAAIAAAGVPAPRVLGLAGPVLFLDALSEARPTAAHWARFGEDLARLHATPGPGYGWPEDYAFGPVALPNTPVDDWPAFWAKHRLLPHLPHLPDPLAKRVDTLARRLPELLPAHPAPGLLHGDLWAGNLLPTAEAIHLIDPASYYGDGEVDLAMLHLFATPGRGFAEGYGPLAPGWQARRAVYSLFPALVHVRLFGAAYHAMAERCLTAAGA
jgi:fructosamine-3-kinase